MVSCSLCFIFVSCSSDDDHDSVDVSITPSSISMYYDGSKQLNGANIDKWTSEDEFVASVDDNGLVKGGHVGETRIVGQSGKHKSYCDVTINAQYNLYDDPILDWGSSMSQIKSKERHSLENSSNDMLLYDYSKSSTTCIVNYGFENGKLKSILVWLPYSKYLTATYYLVERFQPADYDGDLSVMYVDAYDKDKVKTAVLQSTYNNSGTTVTSIFYTNFKTLSKAPSKITKKDVADEDENAKRFIEPLIKEKRILPLWNKLNE